MRKKRIPEYILDLFIVVFGVFLGMLASDWNANQTIKKNKKALLQSIKQELKNNLKQLEAAHVARQPFYKAMDSIEQVIDPKVWDEKFHDKPFQERAPHWIGIGPIKMDDAMFDVAKYSNLLTALELPLLEQLSKTYNMQESMHEARRVLGDKLFDLNQEVTYREVWDYFWRVREEIWGMQYLLCKEYRKAIELIEAHQKK